MSESSKPASKRQKQLLVGLGAALAALALFQALPLVMGDEPVAANREVAAPAAQPRGAAGRKLDAVDQVQLAKLEQEWPAPGETRRNPFTMNAPPPPPSEAPAAGSKPAEPVAPPVATGPPPPPPIPPITLKFIGVISSDSLGKIAGLSDGKFVYRGREGQIVEGRYRIVKIGEESIQIEYVNGTGRQTIRLSGK
jgi:hypothetical protein